MVAFYHDKRSTVSDGGSKRNILTGFTKGMHTNKKCWELPDWSYKVDCCGADLGMSHGRIATEIADKLTGMAIEAEADCIMTSCGLCQINLDTKQSGKNGAKIPVLYFTELMGVAMGLPAQEEWWGKHVVNPRPVLRSRNLL